MHILICYKLYIYFCLISKTNFFFFFLLRFRTELLWQIMNFFFSCRWIYMHVVHLSLHVVIYFSSVLYLRIIVYFVASLWSF